MLKKISILITSYNSAEFIGGAIQSALAQTYQNIEVIVADDGSRDNSQQIISRLAAKNTKIIPIFSDINRGLSFNWNLGLSKCSGEYVATLAGDDLMLPNKVSEQMRFLEEHPDYGLCTHDMDVFESETGKTLYLTSERFRMPQKAGIELMFSTNWFFKKATKNIPSSIMGRGDFLRGHKFDERLKFWNEFLYMIDCMATSGKKWSHLPEVLGRYRVHDKQIHTSKEAIDLSFEEALIALAIASRRYPELSKLIKNKRDYLLFQNLVFDWHKPEKRKALEDQFRREAGFIKWLYMKLCHSYLHHRTLFEKTSFLRKAVKKVFQE